MITGAEIKRLYHEGIIKIDPYIEANVQPNSYDLTLAPEIILLRRDRTIDPKVGLSPQDYTELVLPAQGALLKKYECCLATHMEAVWSPGYIPVIHGRSTLGRSFLQVHQTAGFGDLGFGGYWTLELVPWMDIMLYPGMKIAQIAFHVPIGDQSLQYADRYITSERKPKLPRPGNI